jgi:hypothetical protein
MEGTMTVLTRDVRDRAVAALRKAHAEGRRKATGIARQFDGAVCSCVIIAEAEGIIRRDEEQWPVSKLYASVSALGFPTYETSGVELPVIVRMNDEFVTATTTRTFAEVADMVAALDVVDEAEAICRDAAAVPA